MVVCGMALVRSAVLACRMAVLHWLFLSSGTGPAVLAGGRRGPGTGALRLGSRLAGGLFGLVHQGGKVGGLLGAQADGPLGVEGISVIEPGRGKPLHDPSGVLAPEF